MENIKAMLINMNTGEIKYYIYEENKFYLQCLPDVLETIYNQIKDLSELKNIIVLQREYEIFTQYPIEYDFKKWYCDNHFNKVKEAKPKEQKYKLVTTMTL